MPVAQRFAAPPAASLTRLADMNHAHSCARVTSDWKLSSAVSYSAPSVRSPAGYSRSTATDRSLNGTTCHDRGRARRAFP